MFIAAICATVYEPWIPITFVAWASLIGSSVAIFFGYIVSVLAIGIGDVSFTAQFGYVGFIAAMILGYVFFAKWPDAWALPRAGIIVSTGAFTLYRQKLRIAEH